MIRLVFDTETTGFPSKKLPLNHQDQPHLLQLALILEKDGLTLCEYEMLVTCPIPIPAEATAVHGITDDMLKEHGYSLTIVLDFFNARLQDVECLVAHNIKFDSTIMEIAYARARVSSAIFKRIPKVCTMLSSTPVLKLPGRSVYKRPKLAEVYERLVDPTGFEGAHSALADARATLKVLNALERGNHELVA